MPRSPLPRTLLALLPILSAVITALAAKNSWSIPLSLSAMAAVALSCAVIYWSAPLAAETPAQDLPTAFVPHVALAQGAPVMPVVEVQDALPASPTMGTRADSIATGESYDIDLLTGLLGPEAFVAKVTSDLQRCAAGNQTALLLLCDIDAFGQINRTVGLVDANQMLRKVGDCLRLTVRDGDTLARLGGDEFGIFFPGLPPEVGASRVRDLRAAVREAGLLTLAEGSPQVTACIGTASFPEDGLSFEELLATADASVRRSKEERAANADKPIPSALILTR